MSLTEVHSGADAGNLSIRIRGVRYTCMKKAIAFDIKSGIAMNSSLFEAGSFIF